MDMDTSTRPKYAHNGKVMLGSAILLFLILLIIIFLHACPHSCFRRRRSQRRHTPHLFLPISTTTATVQSHTKGLDPSLFKFLPTFTYSSATPQECAVCLAEFEEDDEGRVLPHCNHGFHSHCIDKWFQSHSNCPICRAPVQPIKISPQRTPVSNSEGEIAGCSNLPPPVGCPRKGLEVVSVVVDEMWSRSSERVEKFG